MMHAWCQNSFEVLTVCVTVALALWRPSLVSAAFVLVTHVQLYPSFFKPTRRIMLGMRL